MFQGLKKKVQKVAKDFGVKYDNTYFSFLLVNKEDVVLRNYLSGIPDSRLKKFGRSQRIRALNLKKYLSSNIFEQQKQLPQGCVIAKRDAYRELNLLRTQSKINSRRIFQLYKTVLAQKNDEVILVPRPESRRDLKSVEGTLSHELMHQLFTANKIVFQEIDPSLWDLDEGLAMYTDYYSINQHKLLEKPPQYTEEHLQDIYRKQSHFFALFFKHEKTPRERITKLKKFYNSLKRLHD